MLKIVYIASSKAEADELEEKLSAEGYLINIDESENGYQIKVPETEVQEVYNYIINNLV